MESKIILKKLSSVLKLFLEIQKSKATNIIEYELNELENIFAILIFSSFIGLPIPATPLSYELLPYVDKELKILLTRAPKSTDMLADIASLLNGL